MSDPFGRDLHLPPMLSELAGSMMFESGSGDDADSPWDLTTDRGESGPAAYHRYGADTGTVGESGSYIPREVIARSSSVLSAWAAWPEERDLVPLSHPGARLPADGAEVCRLQQRTAEWLRVGRAESLSVFLDGRSRAFARIGAPGGLWQGWSAVGKMGRFDGLSFAVRFQLPLTAVFPAHLTERLGEVLTEAAFREVRDKPAIPYPQVKGPDHCATWFYPVRGNNYLHACASRSTLVGVLQLALAGEGERSAEGQTGG